MEYLTFLKILHLFGVIAGFGGALYADFCLVRNGVMRPLTQHTLKEIKQLTYFVAFGLILLWVSGAALALEILRNDPGFLLNEKFWAKITIVSVLTVNGFAVHFLVLKEVKKTLNRRLLIDSSIPILVFLAVCGSVSFVSWMTPFVLGKAPEFSHVIPFETIMTIWFVAILTCVAGVLVLIALHEIWENSHQDGRPSSAASG